MSRRSGLGGGGTPVGGVIAMVNANPYFVDGAQEWLRTGTLKAYETKHAPFTNRAPGACYIDLPTVARTDLGFSGSFRNPMFVGYTSEGMYVFAARDMGGTLIYKVGSSLSGVLTTITPAFGTGSVALGAGLAQMGGRVIAVGNGNSSVSPVARVFGAGFTAGSGIPTSVSLVGVAANSAGTLAVAVSNLGANTANGIYTSTDGINWTARTGTGGTVAGMTSVHWSPCANAFLIACTSGGFAVNRTVDGFTQTVSANDALSTGVPVFVSSPTVTLAICDNGIVRRTTDGVTWSVVDLSSIMGSARNVTFDSASGRFWFFSGHSPSLTYYSTDGVTWVPYFLLRDAAKSWVFRGVFQVNGNTILVGVDANSLNSSAESVHVLPTGLLSRSAPDWVGGPALSLGSTYTFVRIA